MSHLGLYNYHHSDDLEESTKEMIAIVFQPRSEVSECTRISPVEDYVIEENEIFTLQLELQTTLPASLRNNVELGTSRATITIQDASK